MYYYSISTERAITHIFPSNGSLTIEVFALQCFTYTWENGPFTPLCKNFNCERTVQRKNLCDSALCRTIQYLQNALSHIFFRQTVRSQLKFLHYSVLHIHGKTGRLHHFAKTSIVSEPFNGKICVIARYVELFNIYRTRYHTYFSVKRFAHN